MPIHRELKSSLRENACHMLWPISSPEASLPPVVGSSPHAKFVERRPLQFHQMSPGWLWVPEQLALTEMRMIRWNLMTIKNWMSVLHPLDQNDLLRKSVAD